MSTTTEKQQTTKLGPFSIEADPHNNGDIILQSIKGARLRGRIKPGRLVKDVKSGEELVSKRSMNVAEVPGMQIHVNPAKGEYVIYDPLTDNPDLCARIQRRVETSNQIKIKSKLQGVPTRKGMLDKNQMKTLCRELYWLVESGDAIMKEGQDLTQSPMTMLHIGRGEYTHSTEAIDALPGDYLMNSGGIVGNAQPTLEKDMEGWVDRLARSGA